MQRAFRRVLGGLPLPSNDTTDKKATFTGIWNTWSSRMASIPHPSQWSFEIGSFLVLLGEQEELNYRLMTRSLPECFAAAPVAGLQSYMRSHASVLQRGTPSPLMYKSPFGCKEAELRNCRLHRTITLRGLLDDGALSIYAALDQDKTHARSTWLILAGWIGVTWLLFAFVLSCIAVLFSKGQCSWIGLFNCVVHVGWSIMIRLIDRQCVQPVVLRPSKPEDQDAMLFLGRRNSCLAIEGTRRTVSSWTGAGLRVKDDLLSLWLSRISRGGSSIVLIATFVTIPNGTTFDQLAFILLAIVSQLNLLVGQRLNGALCHGEFRKKATIPTPTRTHVYAGLIKRYGTGSWIDATALLPSTSIWHHWRQQVSDSDEDPKVLYNNLAAEDAHQRRTSLKAAAVEESEVVEVV